MAKTERIFEMLEYISKNPNLNAAALGKLCNVTERAIYRYMNDLASMGISVVFRDGGYKIEGDYSSILREADPKVLRDVRLLLLAGMRYQDNPRILKHGKGFIQLIDAKLSQEQRDTE